MDGAAGVWPEFKTVRVKTDPAELSQKCLLHLLCAYVTRIAFAFALPHHIRTAVVGEDVPVLLIGSHIHPGAAAAPQNAL